jgi:hypothetical protein
VGKPQKTAPLREILSTLPVRIRESASFAEVGEALRATTVGIFSVEPPRDALVEGVAGFACRLGTKRIESSNEGARPADRERHQ